MKITPSNRRVDMRFDSLSEIPELLMSDRDKLHRRGWGKSYMEPEFYGVRSVHEAFTLAGEGLPADGVEALKGASERVSTLYREYEMPSITSFYDVTGAYVDVARFLSGEPESMIDFRMAPTPKAGRIVSIVNSINATYAVEPGAITRRGTDVVALVLAIEKMGFQSELWVDLTTATECEGSSLARIRCRVKAPGEQLDIGRIMYAFTHPSMLRVLYLGAMHFLPGAWPDELGPWHGYPVQGLPDMQEYPAEAVLIPPLTNDTKDDEKLIEKALVGLGIL